ncbi:MAG: Zn-dependent oligopeptidase [Elusimicrobiales bacterium]|nr:Zn-dependent oligopeptidase [Elusimicrobiales bacterium]
MKDTPRFNYTVEEINDISQSGIKKFEDSLEAIIAVSKQDRDFENTAYAFEKALCEISDKITVPTSLAYISDNPAIRDASQNLELKISQYFVDVFTREDIFNALNEFASKEVKLSETNQRLLDKILLDFKKNGLGLAQDKRDEVKKLLKELVEIELKFSVNLRDVKDTIEVSQEELKGLPEDYIVRLKKTPESKYIITMDYPDYVPFMENAESDDARRRLSLKFNNRCAKENVKLMEDAISIRRRIAKNIGYPTFADYVLSDRMAKDSDTVFDFLNRTMDKLKEKGIKELEERVALKKERDSSSDGTMMSWQTSFYNNLLKKKKYSIDHEKIKEYFPLETVVKGMFEVFGKVLGAEFKEADLETWHKDVRSYEVKDKDGVIAHFYFDLFPREGKYKHAACFGIKQGRELEDGSYQKPAAAIVANFPKPGGDLPSLMKFDDLVTMFHEFGHVTHNIFTKAKYGKFSGTSVSRDFVEVPSQILENWAYSKEVLKVVSGHYKNPSEKLPDETIEKLIAAKNMDSGLANLRQLFFSILDMKYHTLEGEVDTTDLYRKLMKEISLISMMDGSHPQASFGHLMGGYEAGYYGYLWAKVITMDLFSVFEKDGIMNTETGARYKKLILEPGRTYDELGQVKKFLGRDSNEDAFLKSIGAASETVV